MRITRSYPFVAVAGLLAVASCLPAAEPKAELTDAIHHLQEQGNYSWTATPKTEGSESGRKQGPLEGKTEKSGLVLIKGTQGDNAYEAAYKGEKIIVNFNDDWVAPSELPIEDTRIEQRLKALKVTPAEEAAKLVTTTGSLKKDGDGQFVGDLTPEVAKSMFARLGKRAAEATEAKGTVKFWIKDGRLSKYEHKVQGKITVGTDKKEVEITRTTTVEIKDVGTTKITLPDSARNRLS